MYCEALRQCSSDVGQEMAEMHGEDVRLPAQGHFARARQAYIRIAKHITSTEM